MDTDERKQSVKTGLTTLHDHFDQLRDKHKRNENKDAEQGVKDIQSKLEDVDARFKQDDFAGALSGVESLRSVSHKLERHDDSFNWYDDPVVEEWIVELKTNLNILDELEYDN